MFWLSKELNTQLLAKTIFAFTPDIAMSPLALPRETLHNYVNQVLDRIRPHHTTQQLPLLDVLEQLLTRPTLEEQFGKESYYDGMKKGKQRIIRLESIRKANIDMATILERDPGMHKWWNSID